MTGISRIKQNDIAIPTAPLIGSSSPEAMVTPRHDDRDSSQSQLSMECEAETVPSISGTYEATIQHPCLALTIMSWKLESLDERQLKIP